MITSWSIEQIISLMWICSIPTFGPMFCKMCWDFVSKLRVISCIFSTSFALRVKFCELFIYFMENDNERESDYQHKEDVSFAKMSKRSRSINQKNCSFSEQKLSAICCIPSWLTQSLKGFLSQYFYFSCCGPFMSSCV